MRKHLIGNDKDGYQEIAFTAEEETARDAEEKLRNDEAPLREMNRIRNHRDGLLT